MSAETIETHPTASSDCLYMSMELGEGVWKLGFTRSFGEKWVKRRVASRDVKAILKAIGSVKISMQRYRVLAWRSIPQ
jgi:hypothetical protein